MIEIKDAFNPETKSVYSYYQNPGIGFYIPLYQREYSWDNDNIEQLLEDVSRGVEHLTDNPKDEIRFLGTIIAVTVVDKRKIYPIDPQGLPATIENIIDGQQRLSTISLFATLLFKHIHLEEKKLKAKNEEEEQLLTQLLEICKFWKEKLIDIFSLDLKRGNPPRKPKIIRGNKDQWTKEGTVKDNYLSEVANHIASFIQYIYDDLDQPPKHDKNTRAGKNLNKLDRWLKNTVIPAHVRQNSDFAPAWEIIKSVNEEHIWQYEREDLLNIVDEKEVENKKSLSYRSCSLVQLFAVTHYLLDRCCFTIIQPMNEDWAFDMFQSLNATGTPLTAIETFKPTVVNTIDNEKILYKGSDSEKSFDKVDNLFAKANSASQKSKLAKEFLTSFALVANGHKLESHFSKQRRWLEETYSKFTSFKRKEEFIMFFGNYAQFYKQVWQDYKGENGQVLNEISANKDSELASLIILFLKESNHKMAITVLGSFYKDIVDGKQNSISKFIRACKLLGGFYSLWRAADTNSGLDNVYRQFFRGDEDKELRPKNWDKVPSIDIDDLREYLLLKLKDKGIDKKEDWLKKAKNYCGYDSSKFVSRFILLASSHNTMPDKDNPGLFKQAVSGVSDYLNVNKWNSEELRTIEHVAPQKPSNNDKKVWDEKLYEENELFQRIGNLTLLPSPINTSAGNKGWIEKQIYYEHLGERDKEKQQELANKAKKNGVRLAKETIELLQNSTFHYHIEPIVNLGIDKEWDSNFVITRTEKILEHFWGYVNKNLLG